MNCKSTCEISLVISTFIFFSTSSLDFDLLAASPPGKDCLSVSAHTMKSIRTYKNVLMLLMAQAMGWCPVFCQTWSACHFVVSYLLEIWHTKG